MLVDLARWFFAAKMKVNSLGPPCTWVILLPAPSVLAERVPPLSLCTLPSPASLENHPQEAVCQGLSNEVHSFSDK